MAVIDLCAFLCPGNLDRLFQFADALIFVQVRRASQDEVFFHPIIEIAQHQPICIGMWFHLTYFRDDNPVPVPFDASRLELVTRRFVRHFPAYIMDLLHFKACQSQMFGNFFYR